MSSAELSTLASLPESVPELLIGRISPAQPDRLIAEAAGAVVPVMSGLEVRAAEDEIGLEAARAAADEDADEDPSADEDAGLAPGFWVLLMFVVLGGLASASVTPETPATTTAAVVLATIHAALLMDGKPNVRDLN
ncbi:hypothetical protein KDK95_31610 [Actinospica sp. MGRD01-02]|uniref:Uncharacterized protein n=1 Tax=Actinospica acidithermotolerans TaxID=2828514 RepID=A0A941IKR2_9ACTN|nr:hypothetical protein [Actinospica acidithermotolerans]MBR7830894.1 hypothetical protein [Actinospica acidithermotolerans]